MINTSTANITLIGEALTSSSRLVLLKAQLNCFYKNNSDSCFYSNGILNLLGDEATWIIGATGENSIYSGTCSSYLDQFAFV